MKLSVSRVAATESLEASESSPNQVQTPSINFLPLQIFRTRDAQIPLVDPTDPSLGENLAHTEEVQTDGLDKEREAFEIEKETLLRNNEDKNEEILLKK